MFIISNLCKEPVTVLRLCFELIFSVLYCTYYYKLNVPKPLYIFKILKIKSENLILYYRTPQKTPDSEEEEGKRRKRRRAERDESPNHFKTQWLRADAERLNTLK